MARTAAARASTPRSRPSTTRPRASAPGARASAQSARSAPRPQRRQPQHPVRTRLRIVRRGGLAARPSATGVVDRLVRGPGWIACVGALLFGLVFFNVSLLELNRGITSNSERAAELRRENATLRISVARLASSERIQRAAAERGFVLPAPGEVRYLKSDPRRDARLAARRAETPSGAAVPPAEQQATGESGQAPAQQAQPPTAPAAPPVTQPPATAQAPQAQATPPAPGGEGGTG